MTTQPSFRDGVALPSHVLWRSPRAAFATAGLATVLALLAAFATDVLLVVDRPISEALRGLGYHRFFRAITLLGSPNTMAIASVVAAGVVWRRCRALAMALPVTVGIGIATDVVVKLLVNRPRPPLPDVGTGLSSFPSGHVIGAVVGFGLLVPAVYLITGSRAALHRTAIAGTAITVGVAVSRVALGAHWPSDIIASVVIGAALLLFAEMLVGSALVRQACPGCHLHQPLEQEAS